MRRPAAILLDCGSTLIHIDVDPLRASLGLSGRDLRVAFHAALAIEQRVDLAEAWCLLANCSLDALALFAEALAAPGFYRIIDPTTHRVLCDLRSRGIRLGVVANGEGQLEEELRTTGLHELLDVSIDSWVFGVQKPQSSIFESACKRLGISGSDAWFVGDSLVNDYIGAYRAGFARSVLFDRDNVWSALPVPRVTSLSQLVTMVDAC